MRYRFSKGHTMAIDRSPTVSAAEPADTEPGPGPGGFQWIPIRSLAPRHRPRILAHLLELPPMDRYLRFGHPASLELVRGEPAGHVSGGLGPDRLHRRRTTG